MDYKNLITTFEMAIANVEKAKNCMLVPLGCSNVNKTFMCHVFDEMLKAKYMLEHELKMVRSLREEYMNPDADIPRDMNGLSILPGDRVLLHDYKHSDGDYEYKVMAVGSEIIISGDDGWINAKPEDLEVI